MNQTKKIGTDFPKIYDFKEAEKKWIRDWEKNKYF
jgi:hypothetical protein